MSTNRIIYGRLLNWLFVLMVSGLGWISLNALRNPERLAILGLSGIVTIGFIGAYRWFWWGLQVLRARFYIHVVFPRWRRRARRIPVENLPPVAFLVPTYKEQQWITEKVFRAIALEAKTLHQPITVLVSSSSDKENAEIVKVLKSIDPELSSINLILMVQTGEGKRKAMAEGLRKLASLNLPADTVVALMDGDSEITPGTLIKTLPFFRMFPKMGALTTDELPIVKGSYLFSEWFHLRLAQRHYQMSSVSLSRKVMCLTGRFSLFRAEAALHPSFADQLEIDTLDDWLWGKFKFLSGDDKSTWFWLLKKGYDMIYVPDVIIYSIETISGSLIERAYQNMRRWYGNMLRNSDRAIALGIRKNGWFMFWCLIDQRISYWTSLITPGLLIISLLQQNWLWSGVISSWVLFSRPLMLTIVFWGRPSALKPVHIPILFISQWASSLIKIWTQMNLAQQKWTNRGNQSISAEGSGWVRFTKIGTSRFLLVSQMFCFAITLCSLANLINPVQDLTGLWWRHQVNQASIQTVSVPTKTITAINKGIFPNDGKDDSIALQNLINNLPNQKIQINLPIGEIELSKPLTINRSNIMISGEGIRRTILLAKFNSLDSEFNQAVISVYARGEKPLNNIHLKDFAIIGKEHYNGIVLDKVVNGEIKNLDLKSNGGRSLVMRQTKNIKIEYVALNEQEKPENDLLIGSN